ncbi:MAG: YkgJ family cysteine cluster protein [Myxococcaceae bacterium]
MSATQNPGPCSRCPKAQGRSCCEVKPGEHLATLTLADVSRIAAHTGLAPRKFCEDEWLTLDEAREYELRRPLFAGYFRHGPRRLTLKAAKEACVLLDRTSGCTLPASARPIACRLYPLEPWPDGSLSVLAGDEPGCLAVDESAGLDELRAALLLSSEDVSSLAEQLREDVRQHSRQTSTAARVP